MKRIIILLIAGALSLILIIMLKSCGGNEAIEVNTEHPQKRNIVETVSANGKIQPEVEVKISSDVSGEIIELFVKEGDRVKKGDLLCRIKPDLYESALERVSATVSGTKASLQNTKAQLEQAKANFANAEASFNRNKKLFEQNAISQQDFDVSKAQYESAKAQVKAAEETVKGSEYNINSAEASLKEANENLSKTIIRAPVDGTISKLNKELGERVVGTAQMEGTEIMRLANLNEMEVSVEVNENDIVRVKKNDTTGIEVDAYSDRKFKGIVTEVANSANTTGLTADQVTNFTVKIRILQDSYKDLISEAAPAPFRPGMSAAVEIQTRRVTNAISVPIQAVTTRIDSSKIVKGKKEKEGDFGDVVIKNEKEEKVNAKKDELKPEEVIFILKDGVAKKIRVKTGAQDNDYIEILSGVTEADEVVSGPYGAIAKKLKDGAPVTVVDKDKMFRSEKK
jgi:HlyD family secretion protein